MGGGGGLVTGFSNTDYNHTGNQQQRSERSVYQLFQDWLLVGSVLESGSGPPDPESRDAVLDLETQSLEVRYRIPSQPYEDCLRVQEYYSIVLYSRNIWIISAVFWRNISFSYRANFYLLF